MNKAKHRIVLAYGSMLCKAFAIPKHECTHGPGRHPAGGSQGGPMPNARSKKEVVKHSYGKCCGACPPWFYQAFYGHATFIEGPGFDPCSDLFVLFAAGRSSNKKKGFSHRGGGEQKTRMPPLSTLSPPATLPPSFSPPPSLPNPPPPPSNVSRCSALVFSAGPTFRET